MEKIAYDSVASVPTREPNDRNRLGYQIWIWIQNREGTIEDAVKISGARLNSSPAEVAAMISKHLLEKGIKPTL
jgi:hypothetical protein